jgi:hypothetical protein
MNEIITKLRHEIPEIRTRNLDSLYIKLHQNIEPFSIGLLSTNMDLNESDLISNLLYNYSSDRIKVEEIISKLLKTRMCVTFSKLLLESNIEFSNQIKSQIQAILQDSLNINYNNNNTLGSYNTRGHSINTRNTINNMETVNNTINAINSRNTSNIIDTSSTSNTSNISNIRINIDTSNTRNIIDGKIKGKNDKFHPKSQNEIEFIKLLRSPTTNETIKREFELFHSIKHNHLILSEFIDLLESSDPIRFNLILDYITEIVTEPIENDLLFIKLIDLIDFKDARIIKLINLIKKKDYFRIILKKGFQIKSRFLIKMAFLMVQNSLDLMDLLIENWDVLQELIGEYLPNTNNSDNGIDTFTSNSNDTSNSSKIGKYTNNLIGNNCNNFDSFLMVIYNEKNSIEFINAIISRLQKNEIYDKIWIFIKQKALPNPSNSLDFLFNLESKFDTKEYKLKVLDSLQFDIFKKTDLSRELDFLKLLPFYQSCLSLEQLIEFDSKTVKTEVLKPKDLIVYWARGLFHRNQEFRKYSSTQLNTNIPDIFIFDPLFMVKTRIPKYCSLVSSPNVKGN